MDRWSREAKLVKDGNVIAEVKAFLWSQPQTSTKPGEWGGELRPVAGIVTIDTNEYELRTDDANFGISFPQLHRQVTMSDRVPFRGSGDPPSK